jgi:hypothetical protein
MLTRVYSGFKDQESYEQFEIAYNAFIKKCQTGECPSLAAHVSSHLPFQLSVMISPLYLLVTHQLSMKSFHRRTVINITVRLGLHKSPHLLAVENCIWDAVFCLAKGGMSVYTVL